VVSGATTTAAPSLFGGRRDDRRQPVPVVAALKATTAGNISITPPGRIGDAIAGDKNA
jgi:hypothetical protein